MSPSRGMSEHPVYVKTAFDAPAGVLERLESIDTQLALAENEFEDLASKWFQARRLRAQAEAEAYVRTEGTDTARRLAAKAAGYSVGWEDEARFEICKTKIRTLSDRSTIGMSILRAQAGR